MKRMQLAEHKVLDRNVMPRAEVLNLRRSQPSAQSAAN